MENELQFFQNVPGRFSIGTVDANLKANAKKKKEKKIALSKLFATNDYFDNLKS